MNLRDVKRYDLVGEYDLSMQEMGDDGDYVLHSDFLALTEELAWEENARREAEKVKDNVVQIQARIQHRLRDEIEELQLARASRKEGDREV
jgi:hypothetical protein